MCVCVCCVVINLVARLWPPGEMENDMAKMVWNDTECWQCTTPTHDMIGKFAVFRVDEANYYFVLIFQIDNLDGENPLFYLITPNGWNFERLRRVKSYSKTYQNKIRSNEEALTSCVDFDPMLRENLRFVGTSQMGPFSLDVLFSNGSFSWEICFSKRGCLI